MIKIFQKLIFHNKNSKLNKKTIASVIDEYKKLKNKNLHFLINERFSWMQQFINKTDDGLEVGAGAAFSKHLLNAQTLLTSDFSNDSHLDYQNIDAEKTGLENSKYDFVIASNMMHHVPHPIIFLEEMYRILKPGGKLIISAGNFTNSGTLTIAKGRQMTMADGTTLTNSGSISLTSDSNEFGIKDYLLELIFRCRKNKLTSEKLIKIYNEYEY